MKSLRTFSILFALVAVPSLALAAPAQDGDKGKAAHKAEHQARRAEKLDKFDANDDGRLDDAERDVMHAAMTDERFDTLDSNGDGTISRAEFKVGAQMRRDNRAKHKGMKHGRGKRGQNGKGARRGGKPGKGALRQNGGLLEKVTSV